MQPLRNVIRLCLAIFFVTLLVISLFRDAADAQDLSPFIWQCCFGGSGAEAALAMDLTADGGFVITGFTTSRDGEIGSGTRLQDLLVVKFNAAGQPQWRKVYGGNDRDRGNSVAATSDGGLIVAGTSRHLDIPGVNHQQVNDFWVIKLAANGDVQWQRCYGGGGEDVATSICPTGDGYIVAGYSDSQGGQRSEPLGQTDGWVVKLDLLGDIQWERSVGTPRDDHLFCLRPVAAGGYIAVGRTASISTYLEESVGLGNVLLVRLDADGNVLWQNEYGGIDEDVGYSVTPTADGGFAIAGKTHSFGGDVQGNNGGSDVWIIKTDAAGAMEWQRTYGGNWDECAYSIQNTADDGFVVIGYSGSSQYQGDTDGTHGREDLWLLRLDSDGDQLWQRTLGGRYSDIGYDVRQLPDGSFIAVGQAMPCGGLQVTPGHAAEDVWVLKTGP